MLGLGLVPVDDGAAAGKYAALRVCLLACVQLPVASASKDTSTSKKLSVAQSLYLWTKHARTAIGAWLPVCTRARLDAALNTFALQHTPQRGAEPWRHAARATAPTPWQPHRTRTPTPARRRVDDDDVPCKTMATIGPPPEAPPDPSTEPPQDIISHLDTHGYCPLNADTETVGTRRAPRAGDAADNDNASAPPHASIGEEKPIKYARCDAPSSI